MTDLEKLLSILESVNQKPVIEKNGYPEIEGGVKQIIIQNHLLGYDYFISVWIFDKDGKLLAIGHYE